MGTTTNRGYTYPASTDHARLWEHIQTLADDIDTDIASLFGGTTFQSATPASPLTSSVNTDAAIVSGSFTFVDGLAYELSFSFRWSLAGLTGTNIGRMFPRIRRASTSGTEIYTGGYLNTAGANVPTLGAGTALVKRTAGSNTTQTIVLIGNYSSTNSPTSMAIDSSSTAPARLTIKCIGLATDHTGAIEVPTA